MADVGTAGVDQTPAASGAQRQSSEDARSIGQAPASGNQPDTGAAVEFLRKFAPAGPWVLTFFHPDRKQSGGETFHPGQEDELREWLDAHNGRANIYFHVNPTCQKPARDKAKKEDILAMAWLHLDIDPRPGEDLSEERARAYDLLANRPPEGVPGPATVVIDSGRGFQGFWKLSKPLMLGGDKGKAEEAERYNRWLEERYVVADACHNVDRIMRLPGTVNVLTPKKREKGFTEQRTARLVVFEAARVYDESQFGKAPPKDAPSTPSAPSRRANAGTTAPFEGVWDIPGLGPMHASTLRDQLAVVIVQGHDPDDPNRWPSRSEPLYWVCCELIRLRVDPDVIERVVTTPYFGISKSVLDNPKPAAYARRQVEQALQKVGALRPLINLSQELPDVVDEFEDALLDSTRVAVYQSGTSLVRLGRVQDMHEIPGVRSPIGQLRMFGANPDWLYEQSWRVAQWQKWNARQERPAAARPDREVVRTYMARVGEWRLRRLRGVVNTPALMLDGEVVTEPGWHPSGVFYEPEGVEFPPLPEQPTKEQARAALDLLLELLAEFPFVHDEDGQSPARTVALSAILTGLIRSQLPQAPLHGYDASTPGTGKSYLMNTTAHIVSGRPAAMMTYTGDEAEDEKRWLASLQRGVPVVCLENVGKPLQGDTLCTILSEPVWEGRVLGASTMKLVSTAALVLATGNNLCIRGDACRRSLVCRMDAGVERPEERVFVGDPLREAVERRPELVVAGLTVLRAFILAGCPDQGLTPLNGFETWSRHVRSTLVWLGEPDPVRTQERIRARDDTRSDLGELLVAWYSEFGDERLTAADAIRRARDLAFKYEKSELLDRMEVAEVRAVTPKSLGKWLAARTDRIEGGLRLLAHHQAGRSTRFSVVQLTA